MGCGSGGGSGNPTVHTFLSNDPNSVPAGTMLAVGPFSVPTGAFVDFSIVDTPTGIGDDTMDVGVATDASVQTGGTLVGYGMQSGVSSTTGSTPALPAGDYDFIIQCRNILDDCIFDLTLSATY
jgi:hypothetical protein